MEKLNRYSAPFVKLIPIVMRQVMMGSGFTPEQDTDLEDVEIQEGIWG